MTKHKKLSARILPMALSVAMVFTVMPMTALAAEGDVPLGASSINTVGTIKSFDKLESRFSPSTGTNAPDHVYSLSVALNTPFEELRLPTELTAMVERTSAKPAEDVKDSGKVEETTTTTEQKNVPVSWNSDKEYKSDVNGQFIYTAVLPEGYTLADGVKLPQIYVFVGRQARATGDAITITVNGSTTAVGGATLQAVVEANGGATAVTSLKIIAGAVTPTDWNYLKSLTALQTFEIADTIADSKVASIPDGTSSIPTFPKSIVTVTVPQAVTIGGNVFNGCTALTTAIFPEVTTIGTNAFRSCNNLTTAGLPKATSIGNEAFASCNRLMSISFPAARSIGSNAFFACTALVTLKLPATPPSVGNLAAFANCPTPRALGYVDADGTPLAGPALTAAQTAYKADNGIDDNTTDDLWYGWTIESEAVDAITITVNGGSTPVSGASLQAAISTSGAASVTSLEITEGEVKEADWNHLKSLTALKTFEINSDVTDVANIPHSRGPSIFPKSIESVIVPQAITIGNSAFDACISLTTASFSAATIIGAGAFVDCTGLTTVSFPAATNIKSDAFAGCSELTTASFPTLTEIGDRAFEDCAALATLKLGATTPSIVSITAFDGCPTPRDLGYLATDGTALTGTDLTTAQAAYKAVDDGDNADDLWYGWTIESAADVITIIVNGSPTVASGATLEAAITASGFAATEVTSLEITEGEVTTEDWEYLKNLTALATFDIAETIANDKVADIPNGSGSGSTFPKSIETVTVPQEIIIDASAFNSCTALMTASFPKATYIGNSAFYGCSALTNISFPEVATIGTSAFSQCSALMGASLPKATRIGSFAFSDCIKLSTLNLGKTPPPINTTNVFKGCRAPRYLGYLDADGNALTGDDLTAAQAAYKAFEDGNTTDDLWYGWTIVSATPPTPPTPTPPSGGGGGGSSSGGTTTPSITPPKSNVVDSPVGNKGTTSAVADAVKNAVASGTAGTSANVNYANYAALTVDGLKAINDVVAKAVAGKNIQLNTKVQFDTKVNNTVVSRVTVDPLQLAKVMTDKIGLNVWFDQKKDKQVTAVKGKFEKNFDNKLVIVTFEQKTPLAVNMELALKPDLSGLDTKNLYFYSYDSAKNVYTRVVTPSYWVDQNGYSRITAPFGGSIIITDSPLTSK